VCGAVVVGTVRTAAPATPPKVSAVMPTRVAMAAPLNPLVLRFMLIFLIAAGGVSFPLWPQRCRVRSLLTVHRPVGDAGNRSLPQSVDVHTEPVAGVDMTGPGVAGRRQVSCRT
jgi:hypothetical protein